jgi:uncharacterized protein (TIGR02996 family)
MTPTLTDREALIRAVCEHPTDDLPRLVFADWLDEHGEGAYAEFIRVQCELATLQANVRDAHPDGDSYSLVLVAIEARRLANRVSEAWTFSNSQRWGLGDGWRHTIHADTLAPDYRASTPAALVRRGFVAEIHAPLSVLVGGQCGCMQSLWDDVSGVRFDPIVPVKGCTTCHGTGRITGIGDQLFREQPITRVVCTDKDPTVYHDKDRNLYTWMEDWADRRYEGLSYYLPPAIFQKLERIYQPTREAAINALSDAIIGHFRERVGLSPL